MTDLAHTIPRTIATPSSAACAPRRWHGVPFAPVCVLAVGGATLAGLVAGRWSGNSTLAWDPQLVVLLRFMAAVKLAAVIAASALTLWRARAPFSARATVTAIAALAAMALAPGLIWSLAQVGLAAGLFHAGLLTLLVMAWRDDRVPVRARPAARNQASRSGARLAVTIDRPAPAAMADGTSAQLRR